MNNLKTLLVGLLLALSTQALSFEQCNLILNQAKRQGNLASARLEKVVLNYDQAIAYHDEGNTARALSSLTASESSLYQARSYYVLALFRLDQAKKICTEPSIAEVIEYSSELTLELTELDSYEEKVFDLKDTLLTI